MDAKTTPDPTPELTTPALRHLAWLCRAPQLLQSPLTFEPRRYLPDDIAEQLQAWDQNPEMAPALLRETPQKRLGFYFERLYRVLLEDLLGWDVLLQNRQIQSHGRTIGELDFVVHNRSEDRIEHHEIAIKYYLGVPEQSGRTLWYGPNAKDRLDLKTDRMLRMQSQRTALPEARALLAEVGIAEPVTPRIFMPGYLFYPAGTQITAPDSVPASHLRGQWRYLSQIEPLDLPGWVVLNKPHWIGPWRQKEPPAPDAVTAALNTIQRHSIPLLFAKLKQNSISGLWQETNRLFVVPDSWPQ
ncbi:hypothetical protein SAMN04487881_2992 [Marinobacter sp. es.048]|uniref:DUF1853 family protein n=1 Tax=Marinobacter sp. es.048 TaxID=1761795 RepID=UPI000B58A4A2|nr:DUF1853 family protein [Marinobacter sp. es.048]SNC75605.1 hypothetical protein SAMN04487881_2992 [Marinobacter sp. es.048]